MSSPWPESELRRADFFDQAASEPLRLADGQTWWLRRPRLLTRVAVEPGTGRAYSRRAPRAGDVLAPYPDVLDDLARDRGDFLANVVTLALVLLRENYDLPDEAVPDLFAFDESDPENVAMWRELGRIVQGIGGPKPRAGG